jgi:sulfate adenylyltransferase
MSMMSAPSTSGPLKVLFVCTANICRSPYAELYSRTLADPDLFTFDSAGVRGIPNAPMDPTMAGVLEADSSNFLSKALTRQHVQWADVVLTMENSHRTYLIEDHPGAVKKLFTLGQFVARSSELSSGGLTVIAEANARRTLAKPEEDVTDPYRQGSTVARECADRLNELCSSLISNLSR